MIGLQRNKIMPKCVASSDKYTLSSEQVQFYEDNGYLIVRKLFSLPDLNTYRQRFKDYCNGKLDSQLVTVVKDKSLRKPGAKPEEYINKIQDLLYEDVFSTYTEDPRLLNIVAQLIGDNISAINCTVINKPPGTSEHKAHQDILYMPYRPVNKIVAAWTAIDPVSKENGCLYMIPGSHKPEELYEHVPEESKKLFYCLAEPDKIAPQHKRVHLAMEPGDTVFFGPMMVHGSCSNITENYRKCITSLYVNSNHYFIDVKGTYQEHFAKATESEIKKHGGDLTFIDFFQLRAKQVKGVKSNL